LEAEGFWPLFCLRFSRAVLSLSSLIFRISTLLGWMPTFTDAPAAAKRRAQEGCGGEGRGKGEETGRKERRAHRRTLLLPAAAANRSRCCAVCWLLAGCWLLLLAAAQPCMGGGQGALLTVGLVQHNALHMDDKLLPVDASHLALTAPELAALDDDLIVFPDGQGAHLQRIREGGRGGGRGWGGG
jgi:hypothetical protein